MTRPTLSDVARQAGVSVSTASLAFSGAGPIAEATRARVRTAATELGYAGPNPLGRQLRSGRSGIIGVVVGDHLKRSFRDPVSVQVLDGLVSTLGAASLGVLLVPSAGSQTVDPLLETAVMDVAVLIWGTHRDDPRVATLRRRGTPFVVGEGIQLDDAPVVGIDDRAGVAELARHLAGLGHRRFATITLPLSSQRCSGWVDTARRRLADWTPTKHRLEGLEDAGVDVVATYETEASLVENGHAAMLALLERFPDPATRPTAVVAQSDLLAAGAILAARERGVRVPEDLSVAGFDGLDLPWLGSDRLTTVRQPLAEKGAAIARAVQALLAGETPESVVLPVELVLGTTTAPPAP